jgi:hypothetical protein
MARVSLEDWQKAVGPGWKDLVKQAVTLIETVGGEVFDIKEKFGALRIYYAAVSSIDTLIDSIEERSAITCEFCGKTGSICSLPGGHWLKCMCEQCYKARELERQL